jgi:aspartyl-tRNA(Asn)/glutamyl-tRNA(Gln) amidotransferase subunit B
VADRDARAARAPSRHGRGEGDIEHALLEAKELLDDWWPVVSLEIHVHLKTRTKMFCRCELEYLRSEHARTCPVCLAHPGALPLRTASPSSGRSSSACARLRDRREAVFSRKNYFYPDNPKGYQISQYDQPALRRRLAARARPEGDREIGFGAAHTRRGRAKTIHVGGATGRKVGSGTR